MGGGIEGDVGTKGTPPNERLRNKVQADATRVEMTDADAVFRARHRVHVGIEAFPGLKRTPPKKRRL